MSITSDTLRRQRDLNAALAKITDTQTRDLVRAWATAWDEIAPDLTAALLEQLVAGERVTRAQFLRSTRLRKALAVVADRLDDLAGDAGVRIIGDLQQVIDTATSAQASIVDSQMPPGATQGLDTWSRIDARQLDAIVTRSTQQITSLAKPLSAEAYEIVRRELIRGVAAGSNPKVTARRMVARAERYGFNGGLNRALTIARTETLDAHRAAAQASYAANTDLLRGWVWTAALSERTCSACWSMHGTEYPVTAPGPLGHQNCRCTAVPLVKSWADLGFPNIAEPPSAIPDAEQAFTALPVATQRQILGPARHTAWAAGGFPMTSWAQKRTTDGWRDSYVPASVPKSSGGRATRAA